MGTIRIHDLIARTIIGANSWERGNKQELIINITLEYDSSQASKSDKLKDALDYAALSDQILRTVERSRYLLLEKLAAKLLDRIMTDKRVEYAVVRLDKPHAIGQAKAVSFELGAARK